MKQKVTGIILAGGQSKRMGMEKGLVKFNGKPLIEYALDALKPLCDEIMISANSSFYDNFGYPVYTDLIPNSGPMGGIFTCLLKSTNYLNFVLSCDTPLVDRKTITQIIESSDGFDVAVPWHGNEFFEPLCAVYHKNIIPVFEEFINSGNYKIPDLLKKVNTHKIQTGTKRGLKPELFFNVNSKKQLLELEEKSLQGLNLTGLEDLLGFQQFPNLLMIAGTGRKVGKTTLACKIIQHTSKKHNVVGIKISPHMHGQDDSQKIIAKTSDYLIIEETNFDSDKDSSRMFKAGAKAVYYLQTKDRHIEEPFQILMDIIPKGQPIICESGALLNYAKPSLFLLIKRQGQTSFKKGIDQLPYQPDRWVTFDGEGFDVEPTGIQFDTRGWQVNQ
jgi:molybdopterin-guanine dinucleotide biosynthesis protein A